MYRMTIRIKPEHKELLRRIQREVKLRSGGEVSLNDVVLTLLDCASEDPECPLAEDHSDR